MLVLVAWLYCDCSILDTKYIYSVESIFTLARSGVTDDVKRSLDDIIAAERGLANPIRGVEG